MSVNFFEEKCLSKTDKKLFGLCDDRPQNPAYIDETDGKKWIAVVKNEHTYEVSFVAVDNCINIKKNDGKMDSRCDGLLFYEETIIFVELKKRKGSKSAWIREGEAQLRTTIGCFEKTEKSSQFEKKKAYIANSKSPQFRSTQNVRMQKFYEETGYILRIVNRINLD